MEDEAAKEDFDALNDIGDIGDIDETDQDGDNLDADGVAPIKNEGTKSLDLILDIPLTVAVELGRSKMLINDLLQLGQGSVIELEK